MFKTLDDLKGKKDDKQDNKKNTNSYAGGEKSGLAVENPDDINGIIEKAEKNTTSDEVKGSKKSRDDEVKCKITLYQNGFCIDDGEFRDYNTPENKQFMKELNQQIVPMELRKKYPQGGLSVSLEDKRSEAYRPPTPPKYVAFSGQGQSLGGATIQSQALEVNLKNGEIIVDETKPVTNIQIRLHNGKTVKIKINTCSKVSVLYDYVTQIAPIDGSFELISGFPPRPLTSFNQTIQEADLLDSRVTQKIVH
ncbi:hypothetical protein ABPG72_017403 [Tetrahymena utriculariae]